MREQLRALVKLAEIDGAARDLRRELEELPAGVQEMRNDIGRLETMLGDERGELSEAEALKASYERELGQSNELLSRAKIKGTKARNAREAEAAERELESVRRTIREREEELERLNGAIKEKTESLQAREEKLTEFRALCDEEAQKADVRVAELDKQVAAATEGRNEVVSQLPKPLVRRYERIRTKHANTVVEVVEGTCMGCRMQIPPQQFNEMHRGDDIHQCPHCLRFLYLRTLVEGEG